ncbi:MAG TPA: nucleotide exchange factor GrpE [Holophagaceae bacterium]|nr:nucleotide exchange factor GrpE [Holophagaceae bacterium]
MNPETPLPPEDQDPLDPSIVGGEEILDLDLAADDSMDLQALAEEAATAEETAVIRRAETVKMEAAMARAEMLKASLDEAERRCATLSKLEGELQDQLRRMAADFNNFRSRAQRDTQMAVDQAEKRAFLELLPVLDNFERGLEATYPDLEAFRAGVDLVRKQFLDALRRLGVEPLVIQLGDPFDANHAEALTTLENPTLPDGSVAAVYEKGYGLRGILLRPARVVVNRLPATDPGQSTSPSAPPVDGTEPALN